MSHDVPLRVLACIYDLRVGGAETSLLAEFRRMPALGIQPTVLCLGSDDTLHANFEAAGIHVVYVPRGSRITRLKFLWRFLQSDTFDLVHTMLFWPDVVVRPLARLKGIRVVTSLTNEYYGREHRKNSHHGSLGVVIAQIADAVTSQFASGFHAISARSAHIMSRRLGLRPSRITVIYRGRDLQALGRRTEERRDSTRSRLGVTSETVFLCVGRQDYQKAHEIAVRAFSAVAADNPATELWLAGRPGGNSAVVQEAIAESAVANQIKVLGERSDVADLLCAADFFIMPSRFEGLAGSVIEAMAMEVPLLLTDIPVFREVADNKALYFARDNATSLRDQMRSALSGDYPHLWPAELRHRVEALFDIDQVARDLADFYRRSAN